MSSYGHLKLVAQVTSGAVGAARQTLLCGGAAPMRPRAPGQRLPPVPGADGQRQGRHPHHRPRGGGPGDYNIIYLTSVSLTWLQDDILQ